MSENEVNEVAPPVEAGMSDERKWFLLDTALISGGTMVAIVLVWWSISVSTHLLGGVQESIGVFGIFSINAALGSLGYGLWLDGISQKKRLKWWGYLLFAFGILILLTADLTLIIILARGGGNLHWVKLEWLVLIVGGLAVGVLLVGMRLWPKRHQRSTPSVRSWSIAPSVLAGFAIGLAITLVAVGLAAVVDSRNAFANSKPGILMKMPPQSGIYLALGDSYSAGEGNPGFQHGTSDNQCHRSIAYSYPVILSTDYRKAGSRLRLIDAACSGATTWNVFHTWTRTLGQTYQIPPQVSYVKDVERFKVKLVTITMGGNDLDFSHVLEDCLTDTNCLRDPFDPVLGPPGDDPKSATLSSWLRRSVVEQGADDVAMLRLLRSRFPYARILVIGYPYLLPIVGPGWADLSHLDCSTILARVPVDVRRHLQDLQRTFNNETYEAAVAEDVDYVSPQAIWSRHEPCGPKGQFTNAIKPFILSGNIWFGGSFHPNRAGQWTFARLVACYLNHFRRTPVQVLPGHRRPSIAQLALMQTPAQLRLKSAPGERSAIPRCHGA